MRSLVWLLPLLLPLYALFSLTCAARLGDGISRDPPPRLVLVKNNMDQRLKDPNLVKADEGSGQRDARADEKLRVKFWSSLDKVSSSLQ